MKHGNMRSYGTILTEKLASEKCTTRASPCVRYFIDKDGEKITEPEVVQVKDGAFITPTEYRKRVDNVKGDKSGKFAKLEATYKAVTEVDEGAIIPREVTEQALGTSNKDEGGIVGGYGDKESETKGGDKEYFKVEFEESNRVPGCFGEYDPICYSCGSCSSKEACLVVANNPVEETKGDLGVLAEPEPAWDYHWEERINEVISEVDNDLKSAIEKMWSILKQDTEIIRKMYVTQAEQEFSEKFNQILGGR